MVDTDDARSSPCAFPQRRNCSSVGSDPREEMFLSRYVWTLFNSRRRPASLLACSINRKGNVNASSKKRRLMSAIGTAMISRADMARGHHTPTSRRLLSGASRHSKVSSNHARKPTAKSSNAALRPWRSGQWITSLRRKRIPAGYMAAISEVPGVAWAADEAGGGKRTSLPSGVRQPAAAARRPAPRGAG